ncbi:MAG: DMT family transporter [Sulfitobacter sp.]
MKPAFPVTILMVVSIGLLWGWNWPAVKFMLAEIPPLTLRAAGFSCAALALMGLAYGLGHRLRPAAGEFTSLFLTAFFVLFGFNTLTALGQLFTPSSNAAIIAYTMPSLTALLAALFLGDALHRRLLLAIAISLAGLGLLASADLPALIAAPLGPALMLGAALSWAIGNVLMQARAWTLPPLSRAAWFFTISAALSWPLMWAVQPPGAVSLPSAATLWVFAFHVCGPMIACYVLWTVLLGRLSATVAAISTLIAPVVGVLSSVWLLGDALSWQKTIALALIVTSIALTVIKPRKNSP